MEYLQQYEYIDFVMLLCLAFVILAVALVVKFDAQLKKLAVVLLYKHAPFYKAHILLLDLATKLNIDDDSVKEYLKFFDTNTSANDEVVNLSKEQYIQLMHAQRLIKKYYDLSLDNLTDEERLERGVNFKTEVLTHVSLCTGRNIDKDYEKFASRAN